MTAPNPQATPSALPVQESSLLRLDQTILQLCEDLPLLQKAPPLHPLALHPLLLLTVDLARIEVLRQGCLCPPGR